MGKLGEYMGVGGFRYTFEANWRGFRIGAFNTGLFFDFIDTSSESVLDIEGVLASE